MLIGRKYFKVSKAIKLLMDNIVHTVKPRGYLQPLILQYKEKDT